MTKDRPSETAEAPYWILVRELGHAQADALLDEASDAGALAAADERPSQPLGSPWPGPAQSQARVCRKCQRHQNCKIAGVRPYGWTGLAAFFDPAGALISSNLSGLAVHFDGCIAMAVLGVLFFAYIFAHLIPPDDAQAYLAGVIPLGAAPLTRPRKSAQGVGRRKTSHHSEGSIDVRLLGRR